MLELVAELAAWKPARAGSRCAIATVVHVAGSAPRPIGTSMIVAAGSPGAEMSVLGSLSGGCIEGVVASAALEVLEEGGPRHETFSYSPDEAFAIGLTCGGEIEVRIQELPSQVLQNLVGPTHPVAIITRLTSDRSLDPDTSDSVAVLYRRDELLSSLQSVLAHNSNLIATAIPLVSRTGSSL